MKFFPSDEGAKKEIMALIASMCSSDEQVAWLANRTVALHNEWPGPRELRAVLCSKFRPKDGFEVYSDVYPEGIPSESESINRMLGPAPDKRRLEGGNEAA